MDSGDGPVTVHRVAKSDTTKETYTHAMSMKFIHIVGDICNLFFIAEWYFIVCSYHNYIIFSLMDVYFDCSSYRLSWIKWQ